MQNRLIRLIQVAFSKDTKLSVQTNLIQ